MALEDLKRIIGWLVVGRISTGVPTHQGLKSSNVILKLNKQKERQDKLIYTYRNI